MRLVEKHIVRKGTKEWKRIDKLCFESKNLYNATLYEIKQTFEKTGKFLRYNDLERKFRKENQKNYRILPVQSSQQIMMLIDKAYKGFFAVLRAKKRNNKIMEGFPKPPKYKHKTKGRNIIVFTYEGAKITQNGFVKFPKKANIAKIKTNILNEQLQQVRIVPMSSCYVIEVIYEQEPKLPNENLKEENVISIDIGVNNLCAVTSNQPGLQPFLINGRPLKQMNQYYNKEKAKLQSLLNQNQKTSRRIQGLGLKRKCKIENYLHHASKYLIKYCLENNIGTIIIGHNIGWKQNVNIGTQNNQNFVMIPFNNLIHQIQYKAELQGIKCIVTEEAYTSKCSALDLEPIEFHEEYCGKRIKRGLFRSKEGVELNADVNGSYNILRKVTEKIGTFSFDSLNIGCVTHPVKVNPLQTI